MRPWRSRYTNAAAPRGRAGEKKPARPRREISQWRIFGAIPLKYDNFPCSAAISWVFPGRLCAEPPSVTQRRELSRPLSEGQRQLILGQMHRAKAIARSRVLRDPRLRGDFGLATAEAYWGLIRAAQNHVPMDGAEFATHAFKAIRGQVIEHLDKPDQANPHVPVAEDRPDPDKEAVASSAAWVAEAPGLNPEQEAAWHELVDLVWRLAERLDDVSRQVLEAVYQRDEDQSDIAERLGLEPYQVTRMLRKAEEALRAACREAGVRG